MLSAGQHVVHGALGSVMRQWAALSAELKAAAAAMRRAALVMTNRELSMSWRSWAAEAYEVSRLSKALRDLRYGSVVRGFQAWREHSRIRTCDLPDQGASREPEARGTTRRRRSLLLYFQRPAPVLATIGVRYV